MLFFARTDNNRESVASKVSNDSQENLNYIGIRLKHLMVPGKLIIAWPEKLNYHDYPVASVSWISAAEQIQLFEVEQKICNLGNLKSDTGWKFMIRLKSNKVGIDLISLHLQKWSNDLSSSNECFDFFRKKLFESKFSRNLSTREVWPFSDVDEVKGRSLTEWNEPWKMTGWFFSLNSKLGLGKKAKIYVDS